MFKWVTRYDNWLTTERPVSWLCRVHIMLPLILILYAVIFIITLIIPVWADFKIINFINVFFALIIIFLLFRFEYQYYDKSLNFTQHLRIYLFNAFYLFLLGIFLFISPNVMQKRINKRFEITEPSYYYQKSDNLAPSDYAMVRSIDAVDNISQKQKVHDYRADSSLEKYFDINYDACRYLQQVDYRDIDRNMQTVVIPLLNKVDLKKITDTLKKDLVKFTAGKDTVTFSIPDTSLFPERDGKLLLQYAYNVLGIKQKKTDSIYRQDYYYPSQSRMADKIILRALFTPATLHDSLKRYADSIRSKYEIPGNHSTVFEDIFNTYTPKLVAYSQKIEDNLNIGNFHDEDEGLNMMIIVSFIILFLNVYGMIILLARNRWLGFASPFIFLIVFILIYSLAFISAANDYIKYILITFSVIVVSFVGIALLNKRIRNGIISQAFVYFLNFFTYAFGWGYFIYHFDNFKLLKRPSFYYDYEEKTLTTLVAQSPFLQFICFAIIFFLIVFINSLFIKYYYGKMIRPKR